MNRRTAFAVSEDTNLRWFNYSGAPAGGGGGGAGGGGGGGGVGGGWWWW